MTIPIVKVDKKCFIRDQAKDAIAKANQSCLEKDSWRCLFLCWLKNALIKVETRFLDSGQPKDALAKTKLNI